MLLCIAFLGFSPENDPLLKLEDANLDMFQLLCVKNQTAQWKPYIKVTLKFQKFVIFSK